MSWRVVRVIPLAILTILALAFQARATHADVPASVTAQLTGDFYLPPDGERQVLALRLPAGTYLVTAQLLVGAALVETTCTAQVDAGGAGTAYAQVTTTGPGELAPLPLVTTLTLPRETLLTLRAVCTGDSKAKMRPNRNAEDFEAPGPATWLIATRID
jgi:hypothetical protein